MITVLFVLALVAFSLTIASAVWGRIPLWVSVLLLAIIEMLRAIPLGA